MEEINRSSVTKTGMLVRDKNSLNTGAPEKGEGKTKVFFKIMTGKFSALIKTANPQIQEAQQIPRRVNIKETTPSGQRKKDTCIDLQTRMSADFSSEIEQIKRQRETFLKCFKKNTVRLLFFT